jgi:hypothetical protein
LLLAFLLLLTTSVGGIYTVIKSKAAETMAHVGQNYWYVCVGIAF